MLLFLECCCCFYFDVGEVNKVLFLRYSFIAGGGGQNK